MNGTPHQALVSFHLGRVLYCFAALQDLVGEEKFPRFLKSYLWLIVEFLQIVGYRRLRLGNLLAPLNRLTILFL